MHEVMQTKVGLRHLAVCAVAAAAALAFGMERAPAQATEPLVLEAKIPLGDVKGRIDHMAFDPTRNRLFVAELVNRTVGVVDLSARRKAHVIPDLAEPQGIGYVAAGDTLYVASAGDGSVRVYRAADYAQTDRLDLGDDADNVRVDAAGKRVFVGYGDGALAIIDPATHKKTADIAVGAHPEGFRLARSGRVFVNLPKRHEIAVVDPASGKQIAAWPMHAAENFPMTLDEESERVIVAFRSPAALGVFSMHDGASVANVPTCGDSDDVFVDAKRHRVYVSCGEGFLDVFDVRGDTYSRTAHMPTAAGARTALFSAEADRLFLAVPARAEQPAAIWVYRPAP